jgi:hypothetical protein
MDNFAFWTIALAAAVLGFNLIGNLVSDARERRKRRRNYGRVISRARRPIVMLSVNAR